MDLQRPARYFFATVVLVLLAAACGSDELPDAAGDTEPVAEEQPAAAEDAPDGPVDDDSAPVDEDSVGDDPGDEDSAPADSSQEELFPDVLEASAVQDPDGTWTFSATLSSPYDTPERYADGWRVVGPGGVVYGTRPLAHDHQAEQPFTRSQSGIEIPDDVMTVTIEGRDQISGWGGATVELDLTR